MQRNNKISGTVKSVFKSNTMIFVLVGVMILFEVLIRIADHGSLFAPANITNIIRQNAYVAILATGMLLCILTGGNIDLSVGSVVALVGALAGVFIVTLGLPVWLSICLCLLIGTMIGAFHGFFIAYIHIPPFITTLAGMLLWRGVATIVLDGKPIAPFPQKYLNLFESFLPSPSEATIERFGEIDLFDEFIDKYTFMVTLIISLICVLAYIILEIVSRQKKIKKNYTVPSFGSFIAKLTILSIVIIILGQFLARDRGLPVILILLGIIIAVYSYFTKNTVPGRYLYAIGGNVKAAQLSGINTNNVMFFAYTNMGFISAVAALVTVARLNSAQPTGGTNYEMDAIASCFIGGASAYGGTGTVSGAVVGAIFMGVLNNGMSILGVDMNWQRAVKGMVLLLAVIFDVVSKKKKSR
ncbi:multiple monosaccharide ABC transporter permease [Treponema sp. Marseille-Q3903]|uniref:multiple monosaccharide ABC transporter permease n=1 Tax=Treponema sp. Marseille-Q3903 TaxID=2766703 RepID=UPI001651FDEC|nr:multiple monosaccharide ABC transporter permease [Treponema sp. Marseille-Q3903]MBC6714341.1 sugar ABC transporter permease [Treponema sp. Marseille-Q3903]